MEDVALVVWLAIKCGRLDVYVLVRCPFGFDCEFLSVFEGDYTFFKCRTADHVVWHTRANRIEADHAEHQPGRHLSGIVITGKSVGSREVFAVDDVMHPLLRLPRFAGIGEKVGDVVSRFIAVPVVVAFEESIQPIDETFFSTHLLHEPGDVLRNIPSIMVRSAFRYEIDKIIRGEGFNPASVGMPSTRIACFGIDNVAVVFRPLDQCVIIVRFT